MDRKFVTISLLLILIIALIGIPGAYARNGYYSAFNTKYGTSGTVLDDCMTCHGDTKKIRNSYGQDLEAELLAGVEIDPALVNIEGLDSDGDGYTNIDEINALTKPGDATDYPVVNQPPVANVGGPYSAEVSVSITFDGSGSTDSDGTIVSYDWNFGDGNTGTGVNPTHAYAADGIYTVTLTVTDNDGATDAATATATITVPPPNNPPIADAGGPYSETLGNAISLDGSGSSDTDGTIASYAWDFGDGNAGTGVNPAYTYAAVGDYTVTLTITDNDGATDVATTTVSITDVPPPTSGTVTFVITDADGAPIEGAKIKVDGLPKKGVSTDVDGIAIFADLANGDHTYSVSKRNFITDEGTITVNGDITVNIALNSESGGGGTNPEESSRKDCRDGIDNDGDGLIDAADSGCSKWYK